MKPAIVKWTVDLLAPGAILTPTLTSWYARWEAFHSCRALWPARPIEELLDIAEDGSMALVDFAHLRLASVMDGYDGATDGELDRLLTERLLPDVFDLDRVCGRALQLAPPYVIHKTRASWVELFEVDGEIVTYVRPLSIREIAEMAKQAPGQ